jgi:hypothetical protein
MARPSVSELLAGVCAGLEGSVAPALPDGAAARQLRAALTLLRRLERSWDRWTPYLAEDIQDMRESLRDIAMGFGSGTGAAAQAAQATLQRLSSAEVRPEIAFPFPDERTHVELRACIAALESSIRRDTEVDSEVRAQALALFANLHRRMLTRELHALGQMEHPRQDSAHEASAR